MLFDMQQETLPREDLEALQLRRLRNLCARVYATVPFYAKRFAEVGVTPDATTTPLACLPCPRIILCGCMPPAAPRARP